MKRDMDLIRKMMLQVEESTSPNGCGIDIRGYIPQEMYYNAKLAQEAGLIEATFAGDYSTVHVLRLTYDGHEFLDAARNDTLWVKAKDMAAKNAGAVTLEALKIALSVLIRRGLGG